MIRCSRPGTYSLRVRGLIKAFTVVVEEDATVVPTELPKLDGIEIPDYLVDLRDATVTAGCDCQTRMVLADGWGYINDEVYNSSRCMHQTYLGAVVQRELWTVNKHAYHQHVYPFQLISGFKEDDNFGYYKLGDWHDTWTDLEQVREDGYIIRFHTTQFAGDMMVHCHNPFHADKGMLARECIRDGNSEQGYQCVCNSTEDILTFDPEEAARSQASRVSLTLVGLKMLLLVAVSYII